MPLYGRGLMDPMGQARTKGVARELSGGCWRGKAPASHPAAKPNLTWRRAFGAKLCIGTGEPPGIFFASPLTLVSVSSRQPILTTGGKAETYFVVQSQLRTSHGSMIPAGTLSALVIAALSDLLRRREARQWVAVESLCLPRSLVPLSILIPDYLDRHDDTFGADLVRRGNAVVELTVRADRKLDRARELVVPQHFEFILAGVRSHLK